MLSTDYSLVPSDSSLFARPSRGGKSGNRKRSVPVGRTTEALVGPRYQHTTTMNFTDVFELDLTQKLASDENGNDIIRWVGGQVLKSYKSRIDTGGRSATVYPHKADPLKHHIWGTTCAYH